MQQAEYLKSMQFGKNLGKLRMRGIEMFFEVLFDQSYHVIVHLESSVHCQCYVSFAHCYVEVRVSF